MYYDALGTVLAAYKDFGGRFAIVEEKLPAAQMFRKAAMNKIGRFNKPKLKDKYKSPCFTDTNSTNL